MTRLTLLTFLAFATATSGCGGPIDLVYLLPFNGSGQTGTAALYDYGDDTFIDIGTVGGVDKNPQLTHLRTGYCSSDGVVGGFVLENLETLANGRSQTVIKGRKIGDFSGRAYHVSIQNSVDPSQVSSCADLPATTTL